MIITVPCLAASDGNAVKSEKEQTGKHRQPDVAHFYSVCLLQHLHSLLSQEVTHIIIFTYFFIIGNHNTRQDSQLTASSVFVFLR